MKKFSLITIAFCTLVCGIGGWAGGGNLLRNGDFSDDWITLLPETKNHHWCYPSEFTHRCDFNPDGWICKGSWQWVDVDVPGDRPRLRLAGPEATALQRVNWVAIHDDRTRGNFPDAGGFPDLRPHRSKNPLGVVRDLTLRVRLRSTDVPADAGSIAVSFHPLGDLAMSDPMGTITPPTATASAPLPEGTYEAKWIEVKLTAAEWLKAAQEAAAADPAQAAEAAANGIALPGMAGVTLAYKAAAGSVEVERAELIAAGPQSPNLLANGSFDELNDDGWPAGWGAPQKYRYFPPGHYYIFNTWHNSNAANRGPMAPDALVWRAGGRSLKMIVAAGDEKSVSSEPIVLKQAEPRLIEVSAWVKTDRVNMLQIDAVDDKGNRLDGFNWIHKAPVSIGTDDWRLIRQVFRPREPVQSLRLMLCARGVNGYTLDDTGPQPQNNVTGTIWWDDVRVYEPESTPEELAARGVAPAPPVPAIADAPRLEQLDLGERMLGQNMLRAAVVNPGAAGRFLLRWKYELPGVTDAVEAVEKAIDVPAGGRAEVELDYTLKHPCPGAYTEYQGRLTLSRDDAPLAETDIWFGTWTTPIDLELGALYLRPGQKQFVRMNLGLSQTAMSSVAKVRLEVVRRASGQVVHHVEMPASPEVIAAQRQKIPADLREDFFNLLLADVDVSALPVQPFNDPQRNWFIRATVLDAAGQPVASADSAPFCRQAPDPAQPPVQSVRIDEHHLLYVNDQPWMPWGPIYGHVPVYSGPADPGEGQYRDLANLPDWSIYDRYGSQTYTRSGYDFNCLRYFPGYDAVTQPKVIEQIEEAWAKENLYCGTYFLVPSPGAFSRQELIDKAGGPEKLETFSQFARTAPMVVSVGVGIEEAFGLFHSLTPEQLKGLSEVADEIRQRTGKPVMVSHGGYWNRLEFERVTFFDLFDPETEPFYPANLHTDLLPLIKGQPKAIWLRPQMYEDVPYERWRFHTYVELMRGCRGWQFAHGPGDASLFRGLHGEMEFIKPIAYSADPGPRVTVEPAMETWSRRHNGKTYVIAATTHGIPFGRWRWSDEENQSGTRTTESAAELRTEANAYAVDQAPDQGPSVHGIQYLPDAQSWPAGSRLVVNDVRLDPQSPAKNLVVLVKAEGRWTHSASWGTFDVAPLRGNDDLAHWFLHTFYRHAPGFLGWDRALLETAKQYIPSETFAAGDLLAGGEAVTLEVPLDKIGVSPDHLLDGVAFLHEGGKVQWGNASIVTPDGASHVLFGDRIGTPPAELEKTRVIVEGLKAGTKIRVLFEDREITANDGFFIDDFRGKDLYQRFGAGSGYGDTPVALHVYQIP